MPFPWGALAGLAGSFILGNQQKKSNQASIDAMSAIANRPQRTALGSYFNPGGMSGLSPVIQQGRSDVLAGFPNYKSFLQGSTNDFLRNAGDIRNYFVGGSGNPYGSFSADPTTIFGLRPQTPAMPARNDFMSEPAVRVSPHDWWGYSKRDVAPTFDEGGYNTAMANYNDAIAAQQAYDQRVSQYNLERPTDDPQYQVGNVGNSEFVQAALSPFREAQAQQYDFLQRDLGRRGISGSSLANNQLGNLQSIFAEKMGRVKADATQAALSQALGIDQSALNASTGLVNNLGNLDIAQLNTMGQWAQEQLGLLGLSQAQIGAMMQPFSMAMQNNNQYYSTLARGAMAAGDALGQSGWNPFAPEIGSNTPKTGWYGD